LSPGSPSAAARGSGDLDFPGGSAKIVTLIELQKCEVWPQTFRARSKDHRYYKVIEQTLENDFEYRYLIVRDSSGTVRGIQPFLFVQQNLVEGVPGSARRSIAWIRRAFPKFLTMRVLMVGCAAGEGHLGAIEPADSNWMVNALWHCLPAVAREAKASLIVFKDFPASYRAALGNLSHRGFTRVPSMPATKLALNFANFDDYLAHLSYGTRKNLRRKFRKTERAADIRLEVVTDIAPYVDEVYPLYLAVHERSPMKFEKLSKEYLAQLGRQMSDRARFFIWRINGRIVAFSICLVHEGTFYDEYLWLDYGVAFDLHLYFYTIRDTVSWAIAHRLKSYQSSPLNYDPKLHLGFELAPLDLYVRHTNALMNPIFSLVLQWLEPTGHDRVLRKFPNAAAL
jgi:predicted N-acyltransferase